MHGALAAATNILEPSAMDSNIVQAYIHFEKAHATSPSQRQGKVSATDARKVRWLLIYGTLQYLVSALRAPKEVRDTESPEYALCYVAEPTSTTNSVATTPLASPPAKAPVAIDEGPDDSQSSLYSIEPDCQREDYFTPQNMSRRGSMEVAPLRISQLPRSSSVRSLARRSLSTRGSRSNSLTMKTTQKPTGVVQETSERSKDSVPSSQDHARQTSSVYSEHSTTTTAESGAELDTSWPRSRTPSVTRSRQGSTASTAARPRTPLLDSVQLERATYPLYLARTGEPPSRSDSTSSTASSLWSEGASVVSSKSSASADSPTRKVSAAEESGLLGGLVSFESPGTMSLPAQSHIHPLLRQQSPTAEFEFGFEKDKSEVTHDVHELSQVDSTIGMAVSTPPSPTRPRMNLFPDTRPTFTAEEARALIADKRPNLPYRNRSKSTSSVLDNATSPAKDSMFSTPVSATPTGYWEQYKATLTQQKARSNPGSPTGPTSPSMAKIPTAFKAPFSRLRPRNEEDRGVKTERRLSTLWRH